MGRSARWVRVATKAEEFRGSLPKLPRRAVTDKIVEIAESPDPTIASDVRLVSPAGANSGLIMAFVLSGRWFLIIIYRLMTAEDEIWVESISRVFGED